MPGSNQSKMKILFLLKILNELTDADNPITINQIIMELNKQGITAERKSVYRDLDILVKYGIDIVRSGSNGYFIGNRDFEMPEVKLLIDFVQASKFISNRKTHEMIKKLEGLTSRNMAKILDNQVFIDERIKSGNEQILYNVDKLNDAISHNNQITFQYYDYDINKEKVLKHSGHEYTVNPYALTWFDENYYLIGNYHLHDDISHYRVDRMCNIKTLDKHCKSFEKLSGYKNYFNIADYLKKTYNMFSGKADKVQIRFKNSLINVVIDKFGQDVNIIKDGPDHFVIRTEVNISDGFIAWLFIFGDSAEVLEPEELKDKIRKKIQDIQHMY